VFSEKNKFKAYLLNHNNLVSSEKEAILPSRLFYWTKVIPCPVVKQGLSPSGFEKNLHTSLCSGSIFPKNLA